MNENAQRDVTDRILRHVADHGDHESLREFASEVLRGTITLADGMSFSTYSEALTPKLSAFTQWYEGLSDAERERTAANCAAELEKLEVKLADDRDR